MSTQTKVDMIFVGGMAAMAFALLWSFALWLLWQFDLPHLWGLGGPFPKEQLLDHCLSWPKILLNSMSTTAAQPGWWAVDAAQWRSYYNDLHTRGFIPYGRDVLAFCFSIVPTAFVFDKLYLLQKAQDKKIHVEGKRLVGTDAATRAGREEEKRSQKVIELAPGVPCTLDRIRRSMLILGSIGGGKTQTIWYFLSQLIDAKFKLLIVDGPKGDFSASTPGKPLLLSPWHAGPAWDIARDCPTRGHARELARRLIPSNDKDPIWSNAAQAIFVAAVCKLTSTQPGQWGWGDLYDQVNVSPEQLKETAATYYPPAVQLIADAESRTTQSILINLSAFMADVYELSLAWRHATEKFSFLDWWSRDDHPQQVVILQGSAEFESLAGGYISAIVSLLAGLTASSTFPQSKTRRNLVVGDEFAQLPQMDSFPKFIEIGRSKGCSALIATQSPAQLIKKWGKDTLQSWLAMVGTKVFCRTLGADDQNFVMREIGERKILKKRQSVTAPQGGGKATITTGWEEAPDSIVTTELLEKELGPVEDGVKVLVSGLADPFIAKLPYFEESRFRPEFVPNSRFNSAPAATLNSTQERPDEAAQTLIFRLDPDAAAIGNRLVEILASEDDEELKPDSSANEESAAVAHSKESASHVSEPTVPEECGDQSPQNLGVVVDGIDEFLASHIAEHPANRAETEVGASGAGGDNVADDALKAALELLDVGTDKSKGPKPR